MATISTLPLLRPFVLHLRSTPTMHVIHSASGRLRHEGPGASFWFRPLSAAISEVPVDDRELPLVAHARTADLQDVTASLTVSFRFAEPGAVARHVDFGIDPDTGAWLASPLEQVAGLVAESAAGLVLQHLSGRPLAEAVTGTGSLAAAVTDGLRSDERLAATGIAVLGARVRDVRADADMERALQAPARELALTEADAATNTRRALAVERERTIAENELANRIELALREEALVAQEGANARRRAQEEAAAARVEVEARVERDRLLARSQAERTRTVGQAEAEAETARLAAYATVDPTVLTALALQEGAAHLPAIGSITITPDLLTSALAQLSPRGES